MCRAGFRSALLKHATRTLPSWAGSTLSDVFISRPNQVSQKYQDLTTTLQSWGAKVRAVHIAGSYWAPGFANYLILLQVLVTPALKQLIDSKRRRRTSSLTTWPTARARKTLQQRRPCFAPLSGGSFSFGLPSNVLELHCSANLSFQAGWESRWWKPNFEGGRWQLVNENNDIAFNWHLEKTEEATNCFKS